MPGTARISPALPLLLLSLLASLAGCAGPTQVISTDLTRVSGVYLIAYVDRADVRIRLEDQFAAELGERGLRAVPSHPDLPDIKRASVADMVAVDEEHVRMGTETELADVISHHVADSGDPTRYGTIANTVITVSTSQIQHGFREVLDLALKNPDGE